MSFQQDDHTEARPVSALIGDALQQLSRLLRSEVALARAEVAEKAQRASKGLAMIVCGGLLVMPGVAVLLIALGTFLIEMGLRPSLSYLLAALVGLAVATLAVLAGIGRLKADTLTPNRTLSQLQRDAAAVKEHI